MAGPAPPPLRRRPSGPARRDRVRRVPADCSVAATSRPGSCASRRTVDGRDLPRGPDRASARPSNQPRLRWHGALHGKSRPLAHHADRQRYPRAAVVASGCRGHAEMSNGGLTEGTRLGLGEGRWSPAAAREPFANAFTSQPMQILLRHVGKEPPTPGKPGIFALGGPGVLKACSPRVGRLMLGSPGPLEHCGSGCNLVQAGSRPRGLPRAGPLCEAQSPV